MPKKTAYIIILAFIVLLALAAFLFWYFFYRAVPALPEFSHMTLPNKLSVHPHTNPHSGLVWG